MKQSNFFGEIGQQAQVQDNLIYKSRRNELIQLIKQEHSRITKGVVVLFAAFENDANKFRQDKSFYYYTGINEPGTVLVIDLEGKSTLFVPNCFEKRSQWMDVPHALKTHDAKALTFDSIELLGEECSGYQLYTYFSREEYARVTELVNTIVAQGGTIFTTNPTNGYEYITSRFVLSRIQSTIPKLENSLIDISPLIAQMRRIKDIREIEKMYQAIEITQLAHEAAAQAIADDTQESEVQAALEYIMTSAQARPSFPSIVATGKNGTVLHYTHNGGTIKNGDLVVVDIGAEIDNYCADLTRTYPASGTFTKRQRELYEIVLATQEYVASLVRPGMWLKNKDNPSQSLHHLAHEFLQEQGYADYFPHNIGHFLGLDVHDVGDYSVPLQVGDVITIEPGIYIPEEKIGIRIEDNYWVVKDGVVCLSERLPKDPDAVELLMQQIVDEDEEDESEDEYCQDYDEDQEQTFH